MNVTAPASCDWSPGYGHATDASIPRPTEHSGWRRVPPGGGHVVTCACACTLFQSCFLQTFATFKPCFAWFCLKATEWSTTTTPYPCNLAGDCHASASSICTMLNSTDWRRKGLSCVHSLSRLSLHVVSSNMDAFRQYLDPVPVRCWISAFAFVLLWSFPVCINGFRVTWVKRQSSLSDYIGFFGAFGALSSYSLFPDHSAWPNCLPSSPFPCRFLELTSSTRQSRSTMTRRVSNQYKHSSKWLLDHIGLVMWCSL